MAYHFEKYRDYKDSSVSWVGEVPEGWEMKKLKHIFSEKKITHNPRLPCGSISFGKVVEKPDEKIPTSTKASYQVLNKGEFLVNPLNLNYDLKSLRIGLSEMNVVVSSGYIVLKSQRENQRYLSYMMHRYDVAYMKLLGSGVRQTINFNHIANSLLPIPSEDEQIAIANFLDDKVGKIDAAIAQKEQLIQLLNERKQITIQNAVTKGLNPKAPMRDSGVEWLGEIPEHWEVEKLGSSLSPISIKNHADKPLLSITREKGVIIRDIENQESNHNFIPDDLSGYKLIQKGQFGMNKMKAWQGSYGVSEHTGIVSPAYFIFDFTRDVYPDFFHKAIRSKLYVSFFGSASDGVRIGQWDLSKSRMKQIPIILPPHAEQESICLHIDQQSSKISLAISETEKSIEKLKEYKATLINSAVTGKINVSNYGL